MTGYQSKRAAAQAKLDSMEREALKLALEALRKSFPPIRNQIRSGAGAKAPRSHHCHQRSLGTASAGAKLLHPMR